MDPFVDVRVQSEEQIRSPRSSQLRHRAWTAPIADGFHARLGQTRVQVNGSSMQECDPIEDGHSVPVAYCLHGDETSQNRDVEPVEHLFDAIRSRVCVNLALEIETPSTCLGAPIGPFRPPIIASV